ncbi:flavin reductase [Anaerocaecibacter muris]|uniref:flavin reductase n=1 Tax=Anaerocaecibacter muris TaxID=2941513 RepID=UPI0020426CCF|nr:flavin reductase [Anaerocaecibacter muris]
MRLRIKGAEIVGTAFTDKDRTALLNALNSTGIFVTCGRQTPNIMVTHTGTLGKLWGREVFMLPIRANKYSYRIVSQTKSFALNVPAHDMRNEIALCDTISGFKCNKFETLNLHPKRARKIDAYVLGECGLIVECNLLATISPDAIISQADGFKQDNTSHTLFVGELANCYRLH